MLACHYGSGQAIWLVSFLGQSVWLSSLPFWRKEKDGTHVFFTCHYVNHLLGKGNEDEQEQQTYCSGRRYCSIKTALDIVEKQKRLNALLEISFRVGEMTVLSTGVTECKCDLF